MWFAARLSALRIERLDGGLPVTAPALLDWRHVHNAVVPTAPLSPEDVRDRAGRNLLEVAYRDDVLVGCTTVRPPASGAPATVIVRVLAAHRRQGYGEELFARGLGQARGFGTPTVGTVVLTSNTDGLRFAAAHGFVEVDRYVLPGDTVAFSDLERPAG